MLALAGCSTPVDGDGSSPADTASPGPSVAVCSQASDRCLELGVLDAGPNAGDEEDRIETAQRAFWARVNEQGGIGGRPVVLRRSAEIDGDELAYLGASMATGPRLDALPAGTFVAGTVPLISAWPFEPRVLQTGGSSCVQAMNAVDVLAYRGARIDSLAVAHLSDGSGVDAAAGVRLAAQRRSIPLTSVPAGSGAEQDAVIDALDAADADVVVLALSPLETGVIVAGLIKAGFEGELVTTSRGWQRSMAEGPYSDVLAQHLVVAASWREFTVPTVGHSAMRAALGDVEADEAYTAGWIGNYPLLALLRAAGRQDDLTRAGLVNAAARLDDMDEDMDYEGMLPPTIGTPFSGPPRTQVARRTVFAVPDIGARTRTHSIQGHFNGLTAATHPFGRSC